MKVTKEAEKYAQIIWEYMLLGHKLEKADLIFVMGSHDIQVAERGAELFFKGYAPLILVSGGYGKITKDLWNHTEAKEFSKRMIELGVPVEKIILEDQSTNTRENVDKVKDLLRQKNIKIKSVILVQKPYMERRAYATFMKLWPDLKVMVTSPQKSFKEYDPKVVSREEVFNLMVGDLQRIKILPSKEMQIPQEIPQNVWGAYEKLVEMGFTKQLWRDI